jgi:Gpi18-like mannosyltransferase
MKVIDLLVSIVAPHIIPYLGFFSYGPEMLKYAMPNFIRVLTNFDGIFYIRIALNGYSQTEQAYFPVYPLAIRAVTGIVRNPIIAGVLISHVTFFGMLWFFNEYLKTIYKKTSTKRYWIMAMLLTYPTSYYFGVMYTESIFLFFLVGTLYFQKKEMHALAFLFGYVTGLTRVVGVFLFIPLLFAYYHAHRTKVRVKMALLSTTGPVFGLVTYMMYLWKTTGDPLYFFHAQESFGAQRSTHLILPPHVIYRYIKIFTTAQFNFQYIVAVLELSFYIFALCILSYQLYKLLNQKTKDFSMIGLNIFSFVNIIVPSLTGTLTAMPRYTMVALSIYFALGEIKNTQVKVFLITIFSLLHIVMFAYFVQGYYVT